VAVRSAFVAALIVGGFMLAATQPVHAQPQNAAVPIVTIRVIPHEHQRYSTAGDWRFTRNGDLLISVSRMSDPRYETLIAAHELVEAILCRQAGVDARAVDAFDRAYEARRKAGDVSEPGDSPTAPYHRQHQAATKIERELAALLDVDWATYEKAVDALP
jgi:hypothetical protein